MPIKAGLKKKLEENVNVIKKEGKSEPVLLKKGKPLEHSRKHDLVPCVGETTFRPKVGLSKGCTVNMDNYESLRIDIWLTDEVQPKETHQKAVDRLNKMIDEKLEGYILEYTSK